MSSDSGCYHCILNTVQDECKKQQLASDENRTVDWSFARNALRRFKIIDETCIKPRLLDRRSCKVHGKVHGQSHVNVFWEIFEFLMTSFETLNLRDSTIAADLLRQAHYFIKKYERDELGDSFSDYICVCFIPRCVGYALTCTDFLKLLNVPFQVTLETRRLRSIYNKLLVVWSAIKGGKEQVLSGLLRYGVMFLPALYFDAASWVFWNLHVKFLLYEKKNREAAEEDFGVVKTMDTFSANRPSRRQCIVMMVVDLLAVELSLESDGLERESAPPPRRRLCTARNPADGPSSRSIYFRCLQRAFETIPEPFVSSNELRKIFQTFYGPSFTEKNELHIDELIATYEELFPDGKQPSAPRSLQHLSRCQARENLRQAGTLPHGVRDLGLSALGKYILLER